MTSHMSKGKAEKVSAPDVTTRVTNAVEALKQLATDLGLPKPAPLTANQRRQVTRSRKGAEMVIPTLATLAKEYGVTLPQQSTEEMLSNAELAAQLDPLLKQLVSFLATVTENQANAKSASWSTATTLYSVLKRMSHRSVELGKQIAPVAEFFAYRHPSVRADHPKQKSKKAALAAKKQQQAADAQAKTDGQLAKPSSDSGSAGASSNGDAGNSGAQAAGETKQA